MANEREELIGDIIESVDSRREVADEHLDASIALQIKMLRQQREWTQVELAEQASPSLKQSQISAFENVNHSSWTVATLKRLAVAFDLPLMVSFGSWGQLVYESCQLSRESLERPTIDNDPGLRRDLLPRAEPRIDPAVAQSSESGSGAKVIQFPQSYQVVALTDNRSAEEARG